MPSFFNQQFIYIKLLQAIFVSNVCLLTSIVAYDILSTCICEKAFSIKKINKSKNKSLVTDSNL